jgi:hypothetical protein
MRYAHYRDRTGRGEQRGALKHVIGGKPVRAEGDADPGPPHRDEQRHDDTRRVPGRLLAQQSRELSDAENEHQVEKQLNTARPLTGLTEKDRCAEHPRVIA